MYQSNRAAEHSSDEHAHIVRALAAKDEALAVRLMEEHLHHVEANLDFAPAPVTDAVDAIANAFA